MVYTSEGDASNGKEYFIQQVDTFLQDRGQVSTFSVDVTGNDGCVSGSSVVAHQNNVYRCTREGFQVFGQRPALQDTILTEYVDQTIRARSLGLNYNFMTGSTGVSFKQKIYWSVSEPKGDSFRPLNQLWVLDLTQGQGAWMTDLEVPVDYMLKTNDRDGREQLLIFRDNMMYEVSQSW